MGVRVHGENADVQRATESVGNDVIPLACRYVDRSITLERHQHRKLRPGLVREIEPDRWVHGFGLPCRPQVNAEYQVHTGLGAPRDAFRLYVRRTPGFPCEKHAIGIERRFVDRHIHSRKALSGNPLVAARGTGAIHKNAGMMKYLRRSRPDVDRFHPTCSCHRDRNNEIPEHLRAIGAHLEWPLEMEFEVGLPEPPARIQARNRRRPGGSARGRPLQHPLADKPDLCVGEPPFFDEGSVAVFWQPWRHVATLRYVGDLAGVPPDIFIAQERKRPGLARSVARGTILVNDGRDVAVIRDWSGWPLRLRGHSENGDKQTTDHTDRRAVHATTGCFSAMLTQGCATFERKFAYNVRPDFTRSLQKQVGTKGWF